MSKEIWKPVVGYEGIYEVSDQGHVRSVTRFDSRGRIRRGNLRKPVIRRGYYQVQLYKGGAFSNMTLHRIVLEAFVGPCPEGMEGCHWDDDPTNNCLENLRWDTRSANMYDQSRNGRNPRAARASCTHGHSFDEVNTYYRSNGSRACKECVRIRNRKYRADRREAAA